MRSRDRAKRTYGSSEPPFSFALVIIWNDLACGDREAAAVLVALNSLFQVLAFAGLGWFYPSVLPGRLGLPQASVDVSPTQIA